MKEAFKYRIVVEWSDEDQAFVARVPVLPGCAAHGATAEKATLEAERAAALMLEVLREDGRPLPPEDSSADYSGQLRLRLPKSLHERVSQLASAEGVSLNTLLLSLIAEGCGRKAPQVAEAEAEPEPEPEPEPKTARKRKAVA